MLGETANETASKLIRKSEQSWGGIENHTQHFMASSLIAEGGTLPSGGWMGTWWSALSLCSSVDLLQLPDLSMIMTVCNMQITKHSLEREAASFAR